MNLTCKIVVFAVAVPLIIGSTMGGEPSCTFGSDMAYDVGALPVSVAIGDLNGDDHLDLVVANSGDETISLLFNLGDGSFGDCVPYDLGSPPTSVALADLDGDSDLDLVVTCYPIKSIWPDQIFVLYNDGDANFSGSWDWWGGRPRCVAIGDLDGNGDLDIAVANSLFHGEVAIVLQNTVFPDFYYTQYESVGNQPMFVAAGDLDGNGKLDLVTANAGSQDISVLMGGCCASFSHQVRYGVGDYPACVAIGDLDGDVDLDLAVANAHDDRVSVLLNHGDGTFADQVLYYGGGELGQGELAMDDLDGDGDLDLAVTNRSVDTVSVLLNDGNAAFEVDGSYGTGDNPWALAIGDLDENGTVDLVVANYDSGNVSVLLNECTISGDINGDGDVDVDDLLALLSAWGPCPACPEDIDGSGSVDINDLLILLASWG